MFKIIILINTIKFRLLWETDQYVHETIRIMKLSFDSLSCRDYNTPLLLTVWTGRHPAEDDVAEYNPRAIPMC